MAGGSVGKLVFGFFRGRENGGGSVAGVVGFLQLFQGERNGGIEGGVLEFFEVGSDGFCQGVTICHQLFQKRTFEVGGWNRQTEVGTISVRTEHPE